jgi:ABC-type arginine/histidine transport system permease subunit
MVALSPSPRTAFFQAFLCFEACRAAYSTELIHGAHAISWFDRQEKRMLVPQLTVRRQNA